MTLSYRLRNIVIALVFAAIAVTITFAYAASYRRHVDSQGQSVSVLVASRDIPVGTPSASLVAGGYAKLTSVPKSALVPSPVSKVSALRNLVVSQQIDSGEQISSRRFAAAAAPGVQEDISGALRAVEIAGTEEQVLAGTLQTGEHVDFVASLAVPEGGQVHMTRIIARDLLVLTGPSSSSSSKITSTGVESIPVVLAMTDAQAQAVEHVLSYGNWSLLLRPVTHPTNSAGTIDSSATIIGGGAASTRSSR